MTLVIALGERAIQEGCKRKARVSGGLLPVLWQSQLGQEGTSAVPRTLPRPFMEGTGRHGMPLWPCTLRQGDTFKRFDPKTWGPGVIPVMNVEAIELHVSKGHKMGSEPFQLTDAPFHLRRE